MKMMWKLINAIAQALGIICATNFLKKIETAHELSNRHQVDQGKQR